MKSFVQNIKNNFKYWFMILLWVPFLFWWVFADKDYFQWEDLLYNVFFPSFNKDTVMDMWRRANLVWHRIFLGWASLELKKNHEEIENARDKYELTATDEPSVIVKVTKFLLSIVIAIAVTMILWNWIKYIIETGNWKESKELIPNLIYIVVWIILALFSVTIITIIQSIWHTLEEELSQTNAEQALQ